MIEVLTMNRAPACTVGILLTTDGEIREMNARFRGIDEATDVLTFPAIPNPAGHLGDVAISVDTARVQAAMRGASYTHEMQFLTIHGGLHLLGMNDETPAEQEDMVKAMNLVARRLSIPTDLEWWSRSHKGDD